MASFNLTVTLLRQGNKIIVEIITLPEELDRFNKLHSSATIKTYYPNNQGSRWMRRSSQISLSRPQMDQMDGAVHKYFLNPSGMITATLQRKIHRILNPKPRRCNNHPTEETDQFIDDLQDTQQGRPIVTPGY